MHKHEWDEAKRLINIQKHGIDFADCKRVFDGVTITIENGRYAYGERRFITFGLLDTQVVAIAHTESNETIRVISARKATKREQAAFFRRIRGGV